jgi:hypothetical protein
MVQPKIGYLYIIESEQQKAVKLGFAVNPEARSAPLRTGNPEPIAFRYMILATAETELLLHRELKRFSISREWYPDEGLIDMIINDLMDETFDRATAKFMNGEGEFEELVNGEIATAKDARVVLPNIIKEHDAWIAAGRPMDDLEAA